MGKELAGGWKRWICPGLQRGRCVASSRTGLWGFPRTWGSHTRLYLPLHLATPEIGSKRKVVGRGIEAT